MFWNIIPISFLIIYNNGRASKMQIRDIFCLCILIYIYILNIKQYTVCIYKCEKNPRSTRINDLFIAI